MSSQIIYTVGHSTRLRSELASLLKHYNVDTLIDIRAIPYSRYNPQFNLETMITEFPKNGMTYEHLSSLGGEPPSREVMAQAKSCSERSRGFATHMESEDFKRGLQYVLSLAASGKSVALMCGELRPEHCHRFQVADVVQANGWDVQHIVSETDLRHHPANLFTY
ncbi:MAG: DUF488 domain-containing protein [Ignavibacteriae bacterium]|nr:DUF488 domain-containing protein [Ignavibacteriota bacterium]MCB9214738.1 DUF488 domain-containing protein [Ignavibacteria bacterium]